MRRAIRLCLARVAQDEEEGEMEGVLAPLTPEVRVAVVAVTRSIPSPSIWFLPLSSRFHPLHSSVSTFLRGHE